MYLVHTPTFWQSFGASLEGYAVLFVAVFTFVSAAAAVLGWKRRRWYATYSNKMTTERAASHSALLRSRSMGDNLPEGDTPEIAAALCNVGNIYHNEKKYAKAEEAYRESLRIYTILAKKQPQAYHPFRARLYDHLGTLFRDIKRYKEAQEAFAEALPLYRQMCEKSQENNNLYLWNTLRNLDFVYGFTTVNPRTRRAVQKELGEVEKKLR